MAAESKTGETQGTRRFKYGANVVVATVVALLLVVLINAIGYKRLYRVRFDMTSTRAWSLSPQTRAVLGGLNHDYRVVMLLSRSAEYPPEVQDMINRARDLVGEYSHLSSRLTVEEIDPKNEGRLTQFYGLLLNRYESQLAPQKRSVDAGRQALDHVRREMNEQLVLVQAILDDPQLQDEQLKAFIGQVAQAFARIESQQETVRERLKKAMESPLPDYAGALDTLNTVLLSYDQDVFAVVAQRFAAAAEQPSAPDSVKEKLLRAVGLIKQARGHLSEALEQVKNAPQNDDYAKLRNQIGVETIVVLGPPEKAPRVVGLVEMFKLPNANQRRSGEDAQTEPTFLGEEKITGALVAMELDHQPLVVFVSSGRQPAIGMNGQFEQVAQRLRNMNFQVEQWQVGMRPGPMGQPMPGGPPPQPSPGQKVVWIVPPVEPPNPMQPMPGGDDGQTIVNHLGERLGQGDAMLVMLGVSQMAMFGMPDALAEFVQPWGVTPQLDRLILKQTIDANRRTSATSTHFVTQWPEGSAITRAIAGAQGVFASASPLVIGQGEKIVPLASIRGEGLWAERNLQNETPRLNPETAAESFTVAAAIEREQNRFIVVSDPMWASDQITTYGALGPGTAELFGARFPANAELFVNSVFWLAHLDELIAATSRTQDVRRVGPIERSSLVALQWSLLLGLPVVVAAAGAGVWMVRRKV